jgi:hypothetical protein
MRMPLKFGGHKCGFPPVTMDANILANFFRFAITERRGGSAVYCLQSRWKPEKRKLHYYGLRNAPDLFHQDIKLTKRQAAVLETLPLELSRRALSALGALVGQQVVLESNRKYIPQNVSEAAFCASCCANNFIIPGEEFDDQGLCPYVPNGGKNQEPEKHCSLGGGNTPQQEVPI